MKLVTPFFGLGLDFLMTLANAEQITEYMSLILEPTLSKYKG